MTQHCMFIIWGYVKGVVLLTVLQERPLIVKHCTACRGWCLVVLQHSLPLFDKMAVIRQQKHTAKLRASLATSDATRRQILRTACSS